MTNLVKRLTDNLPPMIEGSYFLISAQELGPGLALVVYTETDLMDAEGYEPSFIYIYDMTAFRVCQAAREGDSDFEELFQRHKGCEYGALPDYYFTAGTASEWAIEQLKVHCEIDPDNAEQRLAAFNLVMEPVIPYEPYPLPVNVIQLFVEAGYAVA